MVTPRASASALNRWWSSPLMLMLFRGLRSRVLGLGAGFGLGVRFLCTGLGAVLTTPGSWFFMHPLGPTQFGQLHSGCEQFIPLNPQEPTDEL